MHRKGAQDAKKAKIFTKIGREIISACKGGAPDPATNTRLRSAIQWAREENMPRERIEGCIKRATGGAEAANYEPIRYEGYGPGGTAIIVTALTDNRHRTAADVRSIFGKYHGNMGETGSVSFMFDFIGRITLPGKVANEEQMLEAAIEAGADNCEILDGHHVITCASDQLGAVRDTLEKKFGAPESAKLTWQPKNTVAVNEEHAKQLLKLIEMLEDNDDVQEVFSNFELSEAILQKLSA